MALRQLGKVRTIVESVGMDISHVWDDLVFLDHTALILQFTDQEDTIKIHRNVEGERPLLDRAIRLLGETARLHAMTFQEGGEFRISQADGENLRLEFIRKSGARCQVTGNR